MACSVVQLADVVLLDVLSDVDKCRRPSELMVTYNPSFMSCAGSSSPAAAADGGGDLILSTEDSVTSLASCTSNSSFSPPSTCLGPHTTSQPLGRSQPLHRPHSVTGLLVFCL